MAYLLRILVAVTIITLCSAQCIHEHRIKKMNFNVHKRGQGDQGCLKDGHLYPLGQSWKTPDCMFCTCNPDQIICCPVYARPVFTDSANCKKTLNKETCKVEVHQNENSDIPCEVDFWVA